jgi:hypothetical protein
MKTPREVLLTRHEAAGPKLDALREQVVGELRLARTRPVIDILRHMVSAGCGFPRTLWRELILPARRIWSGLAAVWVLVLICNLSPRDPAGRMTGQAMRAAPIMVSQEIQQRWMNELLAERLVPAEADRLRNAPPRPHTERESRSVA